LRLDPDTRAALACEWLDDARLEHASVASFARFVLELLALGAPAELVHFAQRALGDEIDHARRCFSLASRYAQEPLGPAALQVDGALAELGLAKPFRTKLSSADYAEVRALGDEYRSRTPRSVET
jgi:hypothetical protein